mmetsp:Transcript_16857/g.54486  ORF Transcript_16857/g.54486 Transcript_16857/m.54486 type:complete len:722 (-) Transcript_16857:13-2178(-)
MEPGKLLRALREVDAATEEHFVACGSLLVWGLRRNTWHPLLSEAFAGESGLLLVSARGLVEGASVDEEVRSCRVRLPAAPASGGPASAAGSCEGAGLGGLAAGFEYGLLDQRLHPVELPVARRLLAELSRARLRLSLPVLVAVGGASDEPAAKRRRLAEALGRRPTETVYVGLRTPACDGVEEHRPPANVHGCASASGGEGGGLAVLETVHVTRPALPADAEVTVGDLLRRCRGSAQHGKVEFSARFDLPLAGLPGSASCAAPAARPELLPGPFVSLEMSCSSTLSRAAGAPLAQVVPYVLASGAAVVHVRCGSTPDGCALSRELLDLAALEQLLRGGDGACSSMAQAGAALLSSEAEAREAVAALLEEEASCGGSGGSASAAFRPGAPGGEEAGGPSRDFVHRLWLRILSRCCSAEILTFALSIILVELGRPGGVVPFVRRSDSTEAAALFRAAVEASTLRRYAAPGEAARLEAMASKWEERCRHFSMAEHAVNLAIAVGVECLHRDFLHSITRQGSVTVQDLAPLLVDEGESPRGSAAASAAPASRGPRPPPFERLQRLCCLRGVAELAELAARHYMCSDTLRRLVLQAVDFYQQPCNAEGLSAPIFSVALSRASSGRLLSSFAADAASSFTVRCGGAFLRAERKWPKRRSLASLGEDDEEDEDEDDEEETSDGAETAPGLWCLRPAAPPGGAEGCAADVRSGRLEYRITAVDRFSLAC